VWLKYVWYIVTFSVSVALWSMRAKPPSPKSARVHVASDLLSSVPLSWVPPSMNSRSTGCRDRLWNWVALKPVWLRLGTARTAGVALVADGRVGRRHREGGGVGVQPHVGRDEARTAVGRSRVGSRARAVAGAADVDDARVRGVDRHRDVVEALRAAHAGARGK